MEPGSFPKYRGWDQSFHKFKDDILALIQRLREGAWLTFPEEVFTEGMGWNKQILIRHAEDRDELSKGMWYPVMPFF